MTSTGERWGRQGSELLTSPGLTPGDRGSEGGGRLDTASHGEFYADLPILPRAPLDGDKSQRQTPLYTASWLHLDPQSPHTGLLAAQLEPS